MNSEDLETLRVAFLVVSQQMSKQYFEKGTMNTGIEIYGERVETIVLRGEIASTREKLRSAEREIVDLKMALQHRDAACSEAWARVRELEGKLEERGRIAVQSTCRFAQLEID